MEITKMTSKGQVVIPQGIREKKNIKSGEKFLVYGTDDSIILKRVKRLEEAKDIKEFERVFNSMWKTAKKRKITKKDVEKEIAAYRKEAR
nr:hypothetical protein [Nanoarchaeum sp.]